MVLDPRSSLAAIWAVRGTVQLLGIPETGGTMDRSSCNSNRGLVSKSVRGNGPKVNRSESVDVRLGFVVVWRSSKVRDGVYGRAGRLGSDGGGGDRLGSLTLTAILMILMNLIILMMLQTILIINDSIKAKILVKTLTLAPWHKT
jgi:hypothetical protein